MSGGKMEKAHFASFLLGFEKKFYFGFRYR